jgi:hypothetical protein
MRILGNCSVKTANDLSRTNARRRLLSSINNELKTLEETALKAEESGCVVRHGKGDHVITLNVGGKEFITLRSTIQNNPVLFNRVTQAEANQEFYKGCVYIDRDPTYFHLILQHLRNRADLMHVRSDTINPRLAEKARKVLFKKRDVLIQIPDKKEALRDFYVEARYFKIGELESLLCAMDWHTRFASWFGSGATNPFYAASQAITATRNALVATSGIGIAVGAQNQELVDNVKGLFRDVFALVRGQTSPENDKKAEKKKKGSAGEGSNGFFSFN